MRDMARVLLALLHEKSAATRPRFDPRALSNFGHGAPIGAVRRHGPSRARIDGAQRKSQNQLLKVKRTQG